MKTPTEYKTDRVREQTRERVRRHRERKMVVCAGTELAQVGGFGTGLAQTGRNIGERNET